jgi:hypothetical protein
VAEHQVTVFEPYPFVPGQKIAIADGPRKGDWEVVAVGDKEVTLRCPLSGKEFTWKRFCYRVSDEQREWPSED